MRRRCRAWLLLGVLLPLGGLAAGPEGGTLTLGVGTQKVLSVPGLTRIAIGDPRVAEVRTLADGQVLLVGQAEGKTSLLLWKGGGQRLSYLVAVRQQDPNELVAELHKLLGDIEGVAVRTVGERIYLDGQTYTTRDAERVQQVVELYPGVKSLVTMAPNAKKLIAQNLNSAFQRAGLPHVQAQVVGSSLFLEGSVESPHELQKADLLVKAFGEKVENLLVVGVRRMVLSEVQFVEVRRGSRDRFGIRYPTDVTGSVGASAALRRPLHSRGAWEGEVGVAAAAAADFSLGLQMNEGTGRLLAQTRLVCASGEQAEFLAGGEVPVPLITENQNTVQFKPYGILLRLRPTVDRADYIQAHIEAEASEVDTSTAVSVGGSVAVPGFRTRKVVTDVAVRNGETIVLSGVLTHDEQKAVSKVPGLGHLPIVGELFKSRALDASERELVIFITPRIVGPDSPDLRSLLEGARQRYDQARGDVQVDLFD